MKLIVVTGAIHFDKDVEKIFENANIPVFSRAAISGHNKNEENDISGNWFAVSNGYQNSIVFFSFTEKDKAEKVLELVNTFNDSIPSKSRVRAFIMSVENHN